MADDISVKLAVAGEKSFASAIKAAGEQVKALDAELKAAVSGFDGMTSAEEKTAAKSGILEKQLEANGTKLEALSGKLSGAKERLAKLGQELERAKQDYGENSKEAAKAASAYNRQAAEVAKLERQIADTNTAINNETKELNQLNNKLLQSGQRWQEYGKNLQATGEKLSSVGAAATKYVTAPLTAAGAAAVKVTADFDTSMSKVQALSGAAGESFDDLRNKARVLGSETKYSASEAADAMANMALAGWDTEQMLTGVDGVLQLAAASGMDLANAADVVAGNLAAFNMEASESTALADLIATAQAKSKTTADQLAEAYSTSATNMTQAGQSAKTTTSLLMGLAKVNDTGSAAGTKLSAVMDQITKKMVDGRIAIGDTSVTVMDANGNFRDMIDIIADIETATYGMGDAERAAALQVTFNRQSRSGLNELLSVGSEQLREYSKELDNSTGSAKEMAETMQDNLAGQLTILKSQIQELAISTGDLLMPSARELTSTAQGVVDKLNALDDGTKELIIKAGLAAAAFGPVTTVTGKMVTGLGNAAVAAGNFATTLAGGGGLASSLTAALGPGGAAGVAIVGAAALTAGVALAINTIGEANDPINRLKKALDSVSEAQDQLDANDKIISLAERYQNLRKQIEDGNLSTEELAAAEAELTGIREELSEATDGAISTQEEYNDRLDDTVQKSKEAAEAENARIDAQKYAALLTAQDAYTEELSRELAIISKLTTAQNKLHSAQTALNTKDETAAIEQLNSELETLQDKLSRGLIDPNTIDGSKEYREELDALSETFKSFTGKNITFTDIGDAQQYIANLPPTLKSIAGAAVDAENEIETLNAELSESQAVIDKYTNGAIELMKSGYLSAEEAANLLGISEEGLYRKTLAREQAEASAVETTEGLTDASREEIDTLLEEAEAAEEAQEAFDNMVAALETMPDVLDAAGYSATEMAQLLTDTGLTAQDFASIVESTRDSIVNSFQKMSNQSELTAQEMIENLTYNLQAQQAWSSNMQQLWSETFSDTSGAGATVRKFLDYMMDQGPEYAAVVQEWANGGYAELAEAAKLWEQAGEQAASDHAKALEADRDLLEDAAKGNTEAAVEAAEDVDSGEAGKQFAEVYADAMKDGAEDAEAAAEGMAKSAKAATASVTAEPEGYHFSAGYASGITRGSGLAEQAAHALVQRTIAAVREAQDSHSPSVLAETEGGLQFTLGYAKGMTNQKATNALIAAGNDVVKIAMEGLGTRLKLDNLTAANVDVVISYLKNKDSERTAEELQIEALESLKDFLEDAEDAWRDSLDSDIRNLEHTLFLAEKSGKATTASTISIYRQMQSRLHEQAEQARALGLSENDEYIQKLQKQWWGYEDEIESVIQSSVDALVDIFQKGWNEIAQQQQAMERSLAGYATLFTHESGYTGPGSKVWLEDLDTATAQLELYGETLRKLQDRGVDERLMDQILAMSTDDANAYGRELLSLSGSQWEAYMSSWQRNQDTAASIAEEFYSDSFSALEQSFTDNVNDFMENVFGDMSGTEGILSDSMEHMGNIAAEAFASAFEDQGDLIQQSFLRTITDAYNSAMELVTMPTRRPDAVTADDYYNGLAALVNGIAAAKENEPIYVQASVTMDVDGMAFAETATPYLRAVNRSSPEVKDD